MIPKTIHYCWLSGDPFPDMIQKCFDTWKEKLPDYEFILWDTKRFSLEDNLWVKQAFEAKKYAFAADYIRLFAVYKYGGIYLDTDIEVLKSFDPLLKLPYFFGSEGEGIIEAGVFGAKKNTEWLKKCLEHYDNRSFIMPDKKYDTLTLPRIMMKQIKQKYQIEELKHCDTTVHDYGKQDNKLWMFPKDFFCAKNHGTGVIEETDRTFCIHHFAMSWLPKNKTFLPNIKRKMMSFFGVRSVNHTINLFGLRKLKKMFSSNQS